jgi:hypothetical protein
MSDINRDEVKARLEASEARTATVAEALRSDSERLRLQVVAITHSVQVNAELAKEQMSSFRSEMSSFRSEMSSFRSEMLRIASETRAEVSGEVHKQRAWILTGALTTLVAILGVGVSVFVRSLAPPAPVMQQQPVVIQGYPEFFQVPSKQPSETRQEQVPGDSPQK